MEEKFKCQGRRMVCDGNGNLVRERSAGVVQEGGKETEKEEEEEEGVKQLG